MPSPSPSPQPQRPGTVHPSPLPVMTILLVGALLAALGIIMVKRSTVPAVGWVFLVIAIVGVVYGVWLAVRNVKLSRTIQSREVAAERRRDRETDPAGPADPEA